MIQEQIFLQPLTLEHAQEMAKAQLGNFKYLAGGTDLMVNRFQGNEDAVCLIDLTGIEELAGVKKEGEYLKIGALTRLDDLNKYPEIISEFPILIEAAQSVGSPLVRKTATIGGNLLCENRCLFYNQSDWWRQAVGYCLKCEGEICIATGGKKACFSEMVSDAAPASISMDALLEISDFDGENTVKLEDIYTGDGVNPRNISPTAILKSILLPLNRHFKSVFKKLRQRESLEFTSLTTAVTVDEKNKLKIAMSGVDPKPVVVEGTAFDEKEELIKKALRGARAIDNELFSRKYRRVMIGVFLRQSFEKLKI